MKLCQKTSIAFAALSLVACAAPTDSAATEAAVDEAQNAVVVLPAFTPPPQLVFQIRLLSDCLPDDRQPSRPPVRAGVTVRLLGARKS
jgi:hypothetical protein